MRYRQGTHKDLDELKGLAVKSWSRYESVLTDEDWIQWYKIISDETTYIKLLDNALCVICTTEDGKIIGMAFLVGSGNPTEIYDKEWCYIRFVSVDPDFEGQGIGRALTTICIDTARGNNEKTIALHSSEFMDKARHLYESLGFTVLREINRRFGKRYWLYTFDLS